MEVAKHGQHCTAAFDQANELSLGGKEAAGDENKTIWSHY